MNNMLELSKSVERVTARFGEPLAQRFHRLQGKRILHFLHIGKTGGSAVKFALRDDLVTRRFAIYLHPHGWKLRNVPEGHQVIFFLREPISRFVSGFHSRRRQGQPKTFVPWSREERAAFECFDSPNSLAEAISSPDPVERDGAHSAMRSIQHVRSSYWDWFSDEDYLRERSSDIFFVGFQENLSRDFSRLRSRLELPETVRLPDDDIRAHRNPSGIDRKLTSTAILNLNDWYRSEYEFLNLCSTIIAERPRHREDREVEFDHS